MTVAEGDAESEVVLVGGTGRSGTHVLAQLLGRHTRLADVPIEARFHCNKRGMPDLLGGRVTLAGFLDKLRGFWWHRVRVDGQPRGLYNLMRQAEFERAVRRFEGAFHEDPVGECRRLFGSLLGSVAERAAKPGLVEMSSHNVREAQTLQRILPRARFLHAVRDGRDSASSVAGKTWGPDGVVGAIDWWAERLRRIEAGVRGEEDGAGYAIGADRFLVVVLDDLVGDRRDRGYAELLDFLGLDDEPAMSEFFERRMDAGSAHLGRWREGLGAFARARVRRKYERTLRALEREGNHVAPPLIAAYERSRTGATA